ncbi:transmembrane protease serine 11D-like [Penaeus japonicus]|uniref:transmembrane protease serine 11D-like n=1 Tax=Penaeus japonicus TaxID=27405 RepID=UPI001C7159E2|nr:transmembrane protease serine 11D-like [Penaeus japonicus]
MVLFLKIYFSSSHPNLADHIVGGVATIPHTYPWQAALVERLKMIPYCGGALVSDLWVLTSCTCTLRTPLDHQVLLGLHDWTIDNAVGLVRRDIAQVRTTYMNCLEFCLFQIVTHPLYGLVALDNDIALLKLSQSCAFGPSVHFTALQCLPALGQKIDDGVMVVGGWGPLEYDGMLSEQLLAIEVAIQAYEICLNLYFPLLTKNMICAGLTDGGKGVCQARDGRGCGSSGSYSSESESGSCARATTSSRSTVEGQPSDLF